ncbi:MAG: hypothetical protein A4E48_01037 [Methanosaeta sp. PtaU1.Bin060]|jgi:hypothetical protein|nr:MAG: hypothetical protein A4E48_01037 [Methanosaeta sp. PtaU1.Bin060]
MHGRHSGQMGHKGHQGMDAAAHGTCGCGCGERRFLSKKEKIEMLEEYKEALKCELEGVEEKLRDLSKE